MLDSAFAVLLPEPVTLDCSDRTFEALVRSFRRGPVFRILAQTLSACYTS